MKTCVSFCSGGGLADVGMMAAGYTPVGAYEIEPAIAEVYRANIADHVHVGDMCDANFRCHEKPDLLWASPSCKNASIANAKGGETATDKAVAEAICRALREWMPEQFILENVPPYASFNSFALIVATLEQLGYWTRAQVFNMANWAVPQTRVRLILRATRGDLVSSGQGALFGGGKLPELAHNEPWRGWYGAIEDLVDSLPESQFAQWQLDRMKDLGESTLVDTTNGSRDATLRVASQPSITVLAHAGQHLRFTKAFITDSSSTSLEFGMTRRFDAEHRFCVKASCDKSWPKAIIACGMANKHGESVTLRSEGEPMFTLTAQTGARQQARAWLETGRVVKMTLRALARFQSVPDSYELPEGTAKFLDGKRHHLAATVIGNGVPPLFAEKLVRAHCLENCF